MALVTVVWELKQESAGPRVITAMRFARLTWNLQQLKPGA